MIKHSSRDDSMKNTSSTIVTGFAKCSENVNNVVCTETVNGLPATRIIKMFWFLSTGTMAIWTLY